MRAMTRGSPGQAKRSGGCGYARKRQWTRWRGQIPQVVTGVNSRQRLGLAIKEFGAPECKAQDDDVHRVREGVESRVMLAVGLGGGCAHRNFTGEC